MRLLLVGRSDRSAVSLGTGAGTHLVGLGGAAGSSLHIYAFINMLRCMRTTIDINDHLLVEAKRLAASRGLSLKALIEEALRERLHGRAVHSPAPVRLATFSGNGLQPGVDLTDGGALLEVMDAEPGR